MAVNEATEDVYVVDTGNNRVEEFGPEGKYMAQFDGSETPAGSFVEPGAIAVDNSGGSSEGDLYVTDNGHSVVDVFSGEGKYLSQLTGTPAAFDSLYGVAVDTSGNLWVYAGTELGGGLGEIAEFSDTGSSLGIFSTEQSVPQGFGVVDEAALAVDSKDNVYIPVTGFRQVAKYSSSGTLLANLYRGGNFGYAVATDALTNNVFVVSDKILGGGIGIEEFGPFGEPFDEPVAEFATEGLTRSFGLAVDGRNGTVYASDREAGVVDVFEELVSPEVTSMPASNIGQTTASLDGSVNPEGKPITSCRFEYGLSKVSEHTVACAQTLPLSGSSPVDVTAEVSGLTDGGTYHYRLVAGNAHITATGGEETFAPLLVLAEIAEQEPVVSSLTRTTALVSGAIDPQELETAVYVQYGPSSSYEGEIDTIIGPGSAYAPAILPLTGLLAGVTSHYRIVATNQAGTTVGPEYTFTTAPATPPLVSTGPSSEVGQTIATITGTVNPNGIQTSYGFEIGTSTSYEGAKLFGNAGDSAGTETITVILAYLNPGTTYHYRILATNTDGTSYGQDEIFTTPGVSQSIVQPLSESLLAVPSIAFPTAPGKLGNATTKKLTNAQKLAKALKACEKQPKDRRAGCQKQAHKRYGPAAKKKR